MSMTDNSPRNCPGCGDQFTPHSAARSRKDHKTPVCSKCGTFEAVSYAVGDILVSPGFAKKPGTPDSEQFNRRTAYMR